MVDKTTSEDQFGSLHKHDCRVCNKPGTWHNRTSEVIRKIHENVWVIERGYIANGMDAGAKTTVIRLPDGRLFIHSPLPIDASMKQAIDELGTVSAVVGPNDHHISYMVHWKKHYPNAALLSPPGLSAKRQDIPLTDELSPDNVPHASYADDAATIQQFYAPQFPFLNETMFFHTPSKTLLSADIAMNYTNDIPFTTKFLDFMVHNVLKKLMAAFTVKDKPAFHAVLDQVERIGFTTLIPCHGDVATQDALQVFQRSRARSFK